MNTTVYELLHYQFFKKSYIEKICDTKCGEGRYSYAKLHTRKKKLAIIKTKLNIQ